MQHTFNINNVRYRTNTPKHVRPGDDLLIIVSANANNQIDSGIVESINCKWGTSAGALKSHLTTTDQFKLISGSLIKKRKTDDHGAMDVGYSKRFVLELDSGKSYNK